MSTVAGKTNKRRFNPAAADDNASYAESIANDGLDAESILEA